MNPLWAATAMVLATVFATLALGLFFYRRPQFIGSSKQDWPMSGAGLLIASPFLVASLIRAFSTSYVSDEVWFLHSALQNQLQALPLIELGAAPNLFAYGGQFWTIVGLVLKLTTRIYPDLNEFQNLEMLHVREHLYELDSGGAILTIQIVRLIALLLMFVWLAVLASLAVRRGGMLVFLPGAVLTLPMMWWAGKLASPELIATALIGIAAILFLRKNFYSSMLLSGLAVGIKVSAAPAALAIAILVIVKILTSSKDARRALSRLALAVLLPFIGYLMMNLYILISPSKYFAEMSRVNPATSSSSLVETLEHLVQSFARTGTYHWDFVSSAGLAYWVGSLLLLLGALVYLTSIGRYELAIASIGAFAITGIILARANAFDYAWYFFPAIALTVSFVAAQPKIRARKTVNTRIIKTVTLLVVTVLLAYSAAAAINEQQQRTLHERDLATFDSQYSCLQNSLKSIEPDIDVYDLSVFGRDIQARSGSEWAGFVWRMHQPSQESIWITGSRGMLYANSLVSELNFESLQRCGDFQILRATKR